MKKTKSPNPAALTRQLLIASMLFPISHWAHASSEDQKAIEMLERQVIDMQYQINKLKQKMAHDQHKNFQANNPSADDTAPAKTAEKPDAAPIKVGGAVRMNYTHSQFDQNNRNTQGDLKFDTFRLNLDGKIDDVILSAEWRYYDYMQVIHHAWIGYKLTPNWQVNAGVIKVPFGNLPFNSNSYYFSSNFYLGLEDNYQLGLSTKYRHKNWTLEAAFLKNTEPSGFRNQSYSINMIGFDNGLDPNDPNYHRTDARPINTFVGRLSYDADFGEFHLTPGVSLMRGSVYGDVQREGHFTAAAAHLNADWRRWNLKLQATEFDYTVRDGSARRLVYGGYAYDSFGALKGKSLTAGIAYRLPLSLGPIQALNFYNDYSRVYDKNAGIANTWMNVTGMSVVAGPVFAYLDYVQAKNQPFVGGDIAPPIGTGKPPLNRLINLNLGYYF